MTSYTKEKPLMTDNTEICNSDNIFESIVTNIGTETDNCVVELEKKLEIDIDIGENSTKCTENPKRPTHRRSNYKDDVFHGASNETLKNIYDALLESPEKLSGDTTPKATMATMSNLPQSNLLSTEYFELSQSNSDSTLVTGSNSILVAGSNSNFTTECETPKEKKEMFDQEYIPSSVYNDDIVKILKKRSGEYIVDDTIEQISPTSKEAREKSHKLPKCLIETELFEILKKRNHHKIKRSYDQIMSEPCIRKLFVQYCKERLCLENVLFIENFVELRSMVNYIDIQKKTQMIYDEFLADNSQFQINTSDTKKQIIRKVVREGLVKSRKNIVTTKILIESMGAIAEELHTLLMSDTIRPFSQKYDVLFE